MAQHKLTSGKLQDLESTLKVIKSTGKITRFIFKLSIVPFRTFEEWIKLLEFEIKQEKERLKFFEQLKIKRKKHGTT